MARRKEVPFRGERRDARDKRGSIRGETADGVRERVGHGRAPRIVYAQPEESTPPVCPPVRFAVQRLLSLCAISWPYQPDAQARTSSLARRAGMPRTLRGHCSSAADRCAGASVPSEAKPLFRPEALRPRLAGFALPPRGGAG